MSYASHYRMTTLVFFSILLMVSLSIFVTGYDDETHIFEDFDGDGLSNSEEKAFGTDPHNADTDGDSYSDGVEIEAGYDPLIPAPGDRIVVEVPLEKNTLGRGGLEAGLTGSITSELQSYIASQAASDGTIDTEAVSAHISEKLSTEIQEIDIEDIDIDRIFLKSQDYDDLTEEERRQREKNDLEEYKSSVLYIFSQVFSDTFISTDPNDVYQEILARAQTVGTDASQIDYFANLGTKASQMEDQLYALAVPEKFIDIHVDLLHVASYLQNISLSQDATDLESDPTTLLLSVMRLQGALSILEGVNAKWGELSDYYSQTSDQIAQ